MEKNNKFYKLETLIPELKSRIIIDKPTKVYIDIKSTSNSNNIFIRQHDLMKTIRKINNEYTTICLNADLFLRDELLDDFQDYIQSEFIHLYVDDELIERVINRQKQCIIANIPCKLCCICNVNSVQDLISFERLIKEGDSLNIINIFVLDQQDFLFL